MEGRDQRDWKREGKGKKQYIVTDLDWKEKYGRERKTKRKETRRERKEEETTKKRDII